MLRCLVNFILNWAYTLKKSLKIERFLSFLGMSLSLLAFIAEAAIGNRKAEVEAMKNDITSVKD